MEVKLAKSMEGHLLIDKKLHPNQLEVGPPELFVCARGPLEELGRSQPAIVEGDSPLCLCPYVPYQKHLLPAGIIRLCLGLILSSPSITISMPQKTPESSNKSYSR